MKSHIRMVALVACLLAWRAECQNQQPEGGGSGTYVTPAYNGDYNGTYTSPAFGSGNFEGTTGVGGPQGPRSPYERSASGRGGYEFPNPGAYSTPAFSAPTLGIPVSPSVVPRPAPKSSPGNKSAAPAGGSAPVKPSGVAAPSTETGGTSTNRLENLTSPPPASTNAPAGPT